MRKVLTVLATLAVALLAFAGPAAAQYGPGDGTLGVDDPNPDPGQTITVGGQGCVANETVTVTIDGQSYETTADEDGNFLIELTAPSEDGTYEIVATCGDLVQSVTITIGDPVTVVPAGTLARTGDDSLPLASIGAVLVALGGLAVLVTRKRAATA